MNNHDSILWQSARNLLDAQENLNKLFHAFGHIECSTPDLEIEELDVEGSDEDFIQPVWNIYFAHRRSARANAKTRGIVTIAIQLTSDQGTEADWADGKRSKVIVGYSIGNSLDEDAWFFSTGGLTTRGIERTASPRAAFGGWRTVRTRAGFMRCRSTY
uniref:Uncharacterized protein n=1 Tax=Paracoccus aminophilus JCM 7686 TaxID=1367847 RepID=E7BLD7_PARAH|nr:hypothetical protein [Paracoccus aminophilus]ADF47142.1 hypothetical protein [Paracoccus aminophilus JCM 7686]